MKRTIFIARPRLDCSFKRGVVPDTIGPALNPILAKFGRFIDQLEAYHEARGDRVISDLRPLWQFELAEMQAKAPDFDRVYFPHRLRSQFPIGENAWYYKNAPLGDYVTVDPAGWGASLSFLPVPLNVGREADQSFERLRQKAFRNESIFDQPPRGVRPTPERYHLFICQLPHDETIQFHSQVAVADGLAATIAFCEERQLRLVVKGHPANPRSMSGLRASTMASSCGLWVDEVSIHTCLADADTVFMINSGSGMEALLHDKPLIRFGRGEYDQIVTQATPTAPGIAEVIDRQAGTRLRAAFIHGYVSRCVELGSAASFKQVLEANP